MADFLIGCIADDFTGGSDAASFLKKGGLHTVLINGDSYEGRALPDGAEAAVIALKTRSVEPEDAVAQSLQAAKWLLNQGAAHIYFKYCSTFDSTDRGNIGPVTDRLMEFLHTPYTILCPALPVNGRTVTNGTLFVNGIPLGKSSMRNHPLNPMRDSRVAEIMARQSKYPCLSLTHAHLAKGREAVHQELERAAAQTGHVSAVVDYDKTEQGEVLAELFSGLPLLTGGSGLLEFLARKYARRRPFDSDGLLDPANCQKPRLLLAGSCSQMTQAQVQAYLASGGSAVKLFPSKLLSGRQTISELKDAIRSATGDLLLYSTASPDERAETAGSRTDISDLLESLMGELALYAESLGYERIIVAGGETSGAVIRRLGHSLLEIKQDIAPGVPMMTPCDRPNLYLVLKSGNFGDETFFLRALT